MLSTCYTANKLSADERTVENSWTEIRRALATSILSGEYPEGTDLPSVRGLVKRLGAHHSTVTRAYNSLAVEGVIEKRAGAPPVVAQGGVAKLQKLERAAFASIELPKLLAAMAMLNLSWADIMALASEK